jgi:dihydropteroate synthase
MTLNLNGQLLDLSHPIVMGILNVTPDSFYADSRQQSDEAIATRVKQIVEEGATIIDVGACSTRPGSTPVSEKEEINRLRNALKIVTKQLSIHNTQFSVDTFRPDVARMAVEEFGAAIINDVSEGGEVMFRMAARLGVAYVLTSNQSDLRQTLLTFAKKSQQLRDYGQKDLLLDPGFGFGKTIEENFRLFADMEKLLVMGLPLLVGISRKSMIYKSFGCTPEEALNGTTVLNTMALMKGASILRVHDVKAAVECCKLSQFILHNS